MKTVIGNYKMNLGIRGSAAVARGTLMALRGEEHLPEVILCPSFTALSEVRKVIARSKIELGAQNMAWEKQGAYTGEVSPRMLDEVNVEYVILGHSERRAYFCEDDEMVNKKVKAAYQNRFTPIVCIGESAEERDAGETQDKVAAQLREGLKGVTLSSRQRLLIAYEPIWAIGSGEPATPSDVAEVHEYIRGIAEEIVEPKGDDQLQVLYGGSVDGENAYSFLREEEIDGVLVGGASIKLNEFVAILDAAGDVLEGLEEGEI
jgi:triosephosphate isomerase